MQHRFEVGSEKNSSEGEQGLIWWNLTLDNLSDKPRQYVIQDTRNLGYEKLINKAKTINNRDLAYISYDANPSMPIVVCDEESLSRVIQLEEKRVHGSITEMALTIHKNHTSNDVIVLLAALFTIPFLMVYIKLNIDLFAYVYH